MDLNVQGGSSIQVSDVVFGADFKESLVHQVVVAYMATARSGTKAQKNRAAVRGGGAKPWRQKGTGRARQGTRRAPNHVGGGTVFVQDHPDHLDPADVWGLVEREELNFLLIVGDAFGGISVPWHLTTREFLEEVAA